MGGLQATSDFSYRDRRHVKVAVHEIGLRALRHPVIGLQSSTPNSSRTPWKRYLAGLLHPNRERKITINVSLPNLQPYPNFFYQIVEGAASGPF